MTTTNSYQFQTAGPHLLSAVAALLLASAAPASAQLETGTLRGSVIDAQGQRVAGADVALLDDRSQPLRRTNGDDAGRFVFEELAPGSYYLSAASGALTSALKRVRLRSALALDIEVQVLPRAAEAVVVTPDDETPELTTRASLSGSSVRRVPVRLAGRGLAAAIASSAGWATEDNGLVHLRGVDDGFVFVIDGIPLYERFDVLFGVAPEPAVVSSLNVITGHLPAEFGLKAGGVIEVNTLGPGGGQPWLAAMEGARYGEKTESVGGQLGASLGENVRLLMQGSGQRSERFLDPVHPDNLHNQGSGYQGDVRLKLRLADSDTLLLGARYGRSEFDVPHGREQERAGQDQRQHVEHALPFVSWQRHWSERVISRLALVGSFTDSDLEPSPADVPLSTRARRSGERLGLLGSFTYGRGRHVLKGGFELSRIQTEESFTFFVTDAEEAEEAELSDAALALVAADPFVFEGRASGEQISGYLQDTWNLRPGLVMDVGLRFDRSALPRHETSWGPRVALAYRVGSQTALRASVNRYFQPPQLEYLLLASSEQARVLSPFPEGGAVPLAERQTGYEVGFEQWLGRTLHLDLAYWERRATNVSDPNSFFGTTIIFPNSVARGEARGLDVRLDLPRRGGLSAYANYTLAKTDQYGPITGGVFVEDSFLEIGPGTRFTPDHDQRHVVAAGVSYDHPSGLWVQATGRYESGTPLEVDDDDLDELAERPGAERIDVQRGRVRPRLIVDLAIGLPALRLGPLALDLRVEALNVSDAAYAFNFGNPFSGTHFGAPRSFGVRARVSVAD